MEITVCSDDFDYLPFIYHLNILKKAGLIFETKEKNYIYYTLNTSVVEEVMLWLSELKGGSSDDQGE